MLKKELFAQRLVEVSEKNRPQMFFSNNYRSLHRFHKPGKEDEKVVRNLHQRRDPCLQD
jgi:hypothetical protein